MRFAKVWVVVPMALLVATAVLGQDEIAEEPETAPAEEGCYVASSMHVDGVRWATVSRLGVHLFGIPVGAGGMTADQRAQVIVNSRLNVLYAKGVLDKPSNIKVGTMHGEVVIFVYNPDNVGGLGRKTLILTIDRNYERFLRCSRWDIAFFWRDLMRLWSTVGLMKDVSKLSDPAGRPLDPEHTWHRVPRGYAARYGH
ncbi:MAG: hypothetical protein N2512_13720 [Armatimonadetes bacterium]|nr:hypothetical protein [Armatimonadota bacterium]